MNAGSWQAIWYELRHGTFWTVLDEILHAIPIINNTGWSYRFCQWAHRHDLDDD